MPISYEPLRTLIQERGIKMTHLRDLAKLRGDTQRLLKEDKHIKMETIEKICLVLDVPIEKVIKIIKE